MTGYFGEERSPGFRAMVQGNKAAEEAPTDEIELQAGGAVASMRLMGGFLTHLVLEDIDGQPQDILYSEADLTRPKLVASHAMLPVGEYDGVGGRHGFARWINYGVADRQECPSPASSMVRTQASFYDLDIDVARTLKLHSNKLELTTRATNLDRSAVRASLGEHFYFSIPLGSEVSATRLTDSFLGKVTLDDLMGDGAALQVSRGRAQFWPGYSGSVGVELPGGRSLNISASAATVTPLGGRSSEAQEKGQLGLLFWQRKGPYGEENPPFLCIEPTYGFDQTEDGIRNDGVTIPPHGGAVALRTTIATY